MAACTTPGLAAAAGVFFTSETILLVRKSGFLCVIWEESTLRKPDVTEPPLFRAANSAASPPAATAGATDELDAKSAGGGGGGRGGAAVGDVEEGAPCIVSKQK